VIHTTFPPNPLHMLFFTNTPATANHHHQTSHPIPSHPFPNNPPSNHPSYNTSPRYVQSTPYSNVHHHARNLNPNPADSHLTPTSTVIYLYPYIRLTPPNSQPCVHGPQIGGRGRGGAALVSASPSPPNRSGPRLRRPQGKVRQGKVK